MDNVVKQLFRPFEEIIKTFSLADVMYVTWGLSTHLQFNKPIPSDIETRIGYDPKGEIFHRRLMGINEWELEFILSQSILNSTTRIITSKTPKTIAHFGPLVNELRTLENEINRIWLNGDESRFKEFFRTAHRQFPWQIPMTTQSTYRYYRIFNFGDLKGIVESKIGLTPKEIYQIGLTLIGLFNNYFSAEIPIKSSIRAIDANKIGLFMYTFGLDLKTLKERLSQSLTFNENLVYGYNPLRANPLIIYENKLYCPLPTLLLWQITSGIYYRIINEKGFNEAFGKSFQDYVGFISKHVFHDVPRYLIYPEEVYGTPQKRTIDWVIEDKESFLMIECKAKRLTISSKSELLDNSAIESDLDKMTSFIIQGYKTILEFKKGNYPHIKYESTKSLFLLILTLEEWFINLNHLYLDQLREKVVHRLKKENIDERIIGEIPYMVDSMDSFERNVQLMKSIGIKTYFNKLLANTIREEIDTFETEDLLTGFFNEEILHEMKTV